MTDEKPQDYAHVTSGRRRTAIVGVLWSGLNSLAPMLVAAGVFLVTSRVLTPGEFGIVAFAASIAMVASALAPAGFAEALVQRTDITSRHLDSVFWLCVGAAVAIYLGLLLLAAPLARLFGEPELAQFVAVLGLRVIFDLAVAVPNAILTRSMSFNRIAVRTTVASLAAGAICLGVLAMGYGAWALALSQLAASVIAFSATMLSVRWRPGWRLDRSCLADLWRFGLSASGSRVITLVNLDQILIGSLLGAVPLGLYGFAKRVFDMAMMLFAGTLSGVTYALLASLQGEASKRREAFLLATFLSAGLSFPAFIGLAVVADDLVPMLFGPQWIAAIPPLQAFCAVGLLACIGVLQASLINSQGKAHWWLWYQAGRQVLTMIVILVFYGQGVTVLTWALSISAYAAWPVAVGMTRSLLDIRLAAYLKTFVPIVLGCAVMAMAVLLVQAAMVEMPPLWRLAASIFVGGLVYSMSLFILARRVIRDILQRLRTPKPST